MKRERERVLFKHIVVEVAPTTAKEDSATLMHRLYTGRPAPN